MRPRFVRPLTTAETQTLTDTYRHGADVPSVRRCHAILLSADGQRVLMPWFYDDVSCPNP